MRKKGIAKLMTVICTAGLLCGAPAEMVSAQELSYEELSTLVFSFSSGVGAWGTILAIHEDGSFEGDYHDMDMGDSGEGYPDGTMYYCNFSGQFSDLVKEDEFTYWTRVESMELEKEPGTSEIIDGIRYIYSEPYGLDSAENILFYLPGTPVENLPEEFVDWMRCTAFYGGEPTELTFTGLYNEASQAGFSSYEENPTAALDRELEEIAARASEIEEQIDSGLLSQIEMNQLSGELYRLWDDELNSLWSRIKTVLPEDSMKVLTAEELDWISQKEAEVAREGEEWGNGSMRPLVENTTAARITRERVYELADYLR